MLTLGKWSVITDLSRYGPLRALPDFTRGRRDGRGAPRRGEERESLRRPTTWKALFSYRAGTAPCISATNGMTEFGANSPDPRGGSCLWPCG